MNQHPMVKISVPPHPSHVVTYNIARGIDPISGRIEGEPIPTGATLHLPAGALVARASTNNRRNPRTNVPGFGYRIELLTVDPDAETGLTYRWHKDFKTDKGRWGKTTAKAVHDLLQTHPMAASGFVAQWGTEHRGANPYAAPCRWCGYTVQPQQGHRYGWGDAEWVEHKAICAEIPGKDGDTCYRCGVTVTWANGRREYVHGQDKLWLAKHRDDLDCEENPIPSYEEQEAAHRARMAEQKRRDQQDRERSERLKEQATAARATRDTDRARDLHAARTAAETEAARVTALLPAVSTTDRLVASKPIWHGAATAHLVEHTLALSDGSTGTRWTVRWGATNTHDHDHTHTFGIIDDARAHYRTVFHDTTPPEGVDPPRVTKADIDAPYAGPTRDVSRGSGGASELHADAYRKGYPERIHWYTTDDEPGWEQHDVPGYIDNGARRSGIAVALSTSSRYYSEDGMSFGVGDDAGYVYTATVRPATPEEARPLLLEEQWRTRSATARHTMTTVLRRRADDTHPHENPLVGLSPDEAEPVPSGKSLSYRDVRHYVDWWAERVWEVTYNGADDDLWPASNYGASIARSWPLTPERVNAIHTMFDLFPPNE